MREAFNEVMRRARQQVIECSPGQVNAALAQRHPGESGDQDFVLVDIREKHEWDAGHIPGAIHVPRGHLEMKIEEAIPDKSRKVILYCAGGGRSRLAAVTLQHMGYEDVLNMDGGIQLWQSSDYPVLSPHTLTGAQAKRYRRQVSLPEIGEVGQLKLRASRVLIIGAGALSSSAALALALAGIGTLSMINADVTDKHDEQHRVIPHAEYPGEYQADLAHAAIATLNPDIKTNTYLEPLDSTNVEQLVDEHDVIIMGMDHVPTGYLVNDAAMMAQKPVVYGNVSRFEGRGIVLQPYDGPCYRCLYPEPPPSPPAPGSEEVSVLGTLHGMIGLLQATETIKLLLDIGNPIVGRLLTYDALEGEWNEKSLFRDPKCPACSAE